ncbi:hypothetical protein ACSVC9_09030 [Clostridium sp. LBM24168]
MDNEDKVLISRQCIDRIVSGLKTIKISENNKMIKKQISDMLNMLESQLNYENLSLEDKILKKMKETKSSDPDMNANLYILYQNLVNGRISEEQALDRYNLYVKIEPYEKTIE